MEITKFNSQLFGASREVTVHLRQALNTLTERGKNVLEVTRRLQEARRTRVNDLRELLANSLDAIVVTNGEITKFSSQLSIASKEVTVHLRQALNTLTERGKNVLEVTRRLQEARRTRVNNLRELLANSLDAIVVTNGDHRLVSANPKALHLFGVSEKNIRQFTIDAFLLENEIPYFNGNGLPFISREENQGECKIKRLNGSLRLADYVCVANFVPFRHLFIFRNDREWAPRKRAAAG
jgi:PAS domain-containing protein